jgi:hypothetical protein
MATRGPGLLPAANGAVAPLAAALVQLVDASQLLPADADQMICGGARTCANAGCSSEWRATGGRDRMLFACAQCAVTLYCSVECQVRARAAAVSHNRLLALAICCCVVVIVVVAAAVSVSHRPACSLRRAQEEDLQYHRAACMCAAQTRRLLDEDAARDAARVADESDSLGAAVGGGAEEDGDTESTPARRILHHRSAPTTTPLLLPLHQLRARAHRRAPPSWMPESCLSRRSTRCSTRSPLARAVC